jgi:hypothetical protein
MEDAEITFLTATKESAARGQLETAITLWFKEGDPLRKK